MKADQVNINVVVIVVLLIIATSAAALSIQSDTHSQKQNLAKLNAMRVAIDKINNTLLPNHFEMGGESTRFINGYPVDLMNGKLRANGTALRQGLDSAYLASETNVSALRGWSLVEMQASHKQSKSLQLAPSSLSQNCFLVYSEAGTVSHPKAATITMVNHGC
ncbi:hypothetical protein SOPP22_06830 [Shewanella sp. OPT22]|nr:hypothetical protein SOPP22_06830 [Shewanella sp. OPT22]